jgi:hypothetical protein
MRWPDINQVLRDLIGPLVDGVANVGPRTPADLNTRAKFVWVRRVDGGNDDFNDFPVFDVDVFAPQYTVAEPLAEAIRQLLDRRRPSTTIDRIRCTIGPRELPWGDDLIRRFGATYEAVTRRRTS